MIFCFDNFVDLWKWIETKHIYSEMSSWNSCLGLLCFVSKSHYPVKSRGVLLPLPSERTVGTQGTRPRDPEAELAHKSKTKHSIREHMHNVSCTNIPIFSHKSRVKTASRCRAETLALNL